MSVRCRSGVKLRRAADLRSHPRAVVASLDGVRLRLPDLERTPFAPVLGLLAAVYAWDNRRLGHGRLRASVDMVGAVLDRLAPPEGAPTVRAVLWKQR